MRTLHLRRFVVAISLFCGGCLAVATTAGAQEDSTTTTQLEVGDGSGDSTTTTQLEVGGTDSTTTTQLDAGAETAPNRVDAGGGGTASDTATTPLALIAFAGGLIIVTTAAARKIRSE